MFGWVGTPFFFFSSNSKHIFLHCKHQYDTRVIWLGEGKRGEGEEGKVFLSFLLVMLSRLLICHLQVDGDVTLTAVVRTQEKVQMPCSVRVKTM